MAVERIERYRQKNGLDILKVWLYPTTKFPSGSYFYCEARDEDLVNKLSWYMEKTYEPYIVGDSTIDGVHTHHKFHREIAFKILHYYPEYIDHRNRVAFDNVDDDNLFVVSNGENGQNQRTKGYTVRWDRGGTFVGMLKREQKCIRLRTSFSEIDAMYCRNRLEEEYFDYRYDFLLDRRDDIDLLEDEREGRISHDEAVYKHVLRYKSNPWFFFRYELEDYYRQNNIQLPVTGKDYMERDGFLTDLEGNRLCPKIWQ